MLISAEQAFCHRGQRSPFVYSFHTLADLWHREAYSTLICEVLQRMKDEEPKPPLRGYKLPAYRIIEGQSFRPGEVFLGEGGTANIVPALPGPPFEDFMVCKYCEDLHPNRTEADECRQFHLKKQAEDAILKERRNHHNCWARARS